MKKRVLNIIFAFLFCLAIFAVPALFFLQPDREFSEREKRYLAQRPEWSADGFVSGEYAEKLEDYLADQFPERELFVGINAYYDLFSGRQSTKDYLVTRSGRLFARPAEVDRKTLDANLEAVNAFTRTLEETEIGIPVSLMLVPSSGAVLLEGKGYPDAEVIAYAYDRAETGHVDLLSAFRSETDPGSLYYRTDHHWTSEGAYEAACAYRRSLGLPAVPRQNYSRQGRENFYGSAYSGAGLWLTKPDSLELWVSGNVLQVSNETGGVNNGVFYPERLQEQDKYTVFLDGNHSLVRIENLSGGLDEGKNLLVIRDSFSNSLGCFLADLYDKVILVDLRYYRLPLTELLLDEEIDEILIEYSVDNFVTDTNLSFLSVDPEPLRQKVEEERRPPNYFAPPPQLTDELFDGAYYLGDSVNGILGAYCLNNGKLRNTYISTNALLSYGEIVDQIRGHLIYGGQFATLPEVLEERRPSIIISNLGCNDLARSELDRCEDNVLRFLEMVRSFDPNITIFIQSVMPIRANMTTFNQQKVDEFNDWVRDNAKTYGYCYIELDKYFKGPDGKLSFDYKYNDTHIKPMGAPIWYRELLNVDNYYNFPEQFYVEYDGETNLPVEGGSAPAEETPPPPEEVREDTVLDAVYRRICGELALPEMLELDERTTSGYLGLEPEDFRDGRFYLCANNLKAEEIWLAELEDEDAARAMADRARERIEVKARSYDAYLPEESEIIRRGIVAVKGRYVGLFLSPDAERMEEIFLSSLE